VPHNPKKIHYKCVCTKKIIYKKKKKKKRWSNNPRRPNGLTQLHINRFLLPSAIKKQNSLKNKKTFNLPNTSLTFIHVESTESRSKSN